MKDFQKCSINLYLCTIFRIY